MGNIQNNQQKQFFLHKTGTHNQLINDSSSESGSLSINQFDNQEIIDRPRQLPNLNIQATPFKKLDEQKLQSNTKLSFFIPPKNLTWVEVIQHPYLFSRILDYLAPSQEQKIMLTNKRFYCQMYTHRLNRANNWQLIMWKLERKNKTVNYDLVSHNQQQSQHSLDLDRTQSFFAIDDDIQSQVNKLDRVMRALAVEMPYFQGLNSIVAVLLAYFEQQKTYEITKLLIHKCQDIQNNCQKYNEFIQAIEGQIKSITPYLFSVLSEQDLDIEYFVMKWVLGLFSYDCTRELLLILWNHIAVFGLKFLKYFIISIFYILESQPLQIHEQKQQCTLIFGNLAVVGDNRCDALNSLLKDKIKQILRQRFSCIIATTNNFMIESKFGVKRNEISHTISNQSMNQYEYEDQGMHEKHKNMELFLKGPSKLWYLQNQSYSQINLSPKKPQYLSLTQSLSFKMIRSFNFC